jgi:hypothetical protein
MANEDAAPAATQYWLNLAGGTMNNQPELFELKQNAAPRQERDESAEVARRQTARVRS